MTGLDLLLLALAAALAIALNVYDAWRSRRCAWCGQARPTLRHYFDTHHLER